METRDVRLDELGLIITGKTPPTKNPDYYGGDTPFLTPSDDMNGKYAPNTARKLSETGVGVVRRCLLPAGSICMSCIGSDLGKVVVAREPLVTNQQINSIIPSQELVDLDFLYYSMLPLGRRLNALSKTSTAVPIVNKSTFSDCIIALPDIHAQRAIGYILATIDQKIEINRRANDYLAELVRTEFDYRYGVDTPTVALSDVLTISTKSLKPSSYIGEIWEHFSIPAFDEGCGPVFEPADGIKSNKYVIDNDCILISKLNPSTKRLWLPQCTSNRPVCSTEFIVYKTKVAAHKSFYYAAIDSPCFTDFLLAHVTGSTGSRQRTQPKATLDYPMPFPGTDEIEDFCAYADPLIKQWQVNERESVKLAQLRDALLPKLMSGEIDVSGVEIPTQPNNHLYAG